MTKLASNIKFFRKKMNINQSQLADLLKVSQTSVAHYEKGDRQPTIETLMSLSSLFEVNIDTLIGHKRPALEKKKIESNKAIIDHICELLICKKSDEFIAYMMSLSTEYRVTSLIDDLIKVVLYKIGEMWEAGTISEADEHYATHMIRKVMQHIMMKKMAVYKNRKAITLAVHTEQHTLGIELVSSFLEENGIKTLYLGSQVPMKSLNQLIKDYQPDFLFLSVTLREHLNSLMMILDHLEESNYQIVIGGQAAIFAKDLLKEKGNMVFITKMEELVDLIA